MELSSYPNHENRKTTLLHDEMQIMLTLADPLEIEKFLLSVDPPLFKKKPLSISEIKVALEVELKDGKRSVGFADAMIRFMAMMPPDHENKEEWRNWGAVIIEIKTEIPSFGEAMRQINKYRKASGEYLIGHGNPLILICDTLSQQELEAFKSQGVHVYDPLFVWPAQTAQKAIAEIPVTAPPQPQWVPCEPVPIPPPPNRPQNDFEDAIALIDLIDNDDARESVKAALTASFEGKEKKELWAMLTAEQKAKLKS